MLKELPTIAFEEIAELFNFILQYGYIADAWKVSIIKIIDKQNKNNAISASYRAISLLPTPFTVCENCHGQITTTLIECKSNS